MADNAFDLIVIGSGPGGYVAAIRAAQLGLRVACVEKYSAPGGTCLNVGCIPSKALLESSEKFAELSRLSTHGISVDNVTLDLPTLLARKDKVVSTLTKGISFLFNKNKVERFEGTASLLDAHTVKVAGNSPASLTAPSILIATGSKASTLPGVELDGTSVCTSTEALSFSEVPKRLVVIGAGAIGLELGSVWARLGSEVTVVEYFDRVLPGADMEISKQCLRSLKKQGLKFVLKAKVQGVKTSEGVSTVEIEGADAIEADKVLVAVGRRPNTEGLGLNVAGVKVTDRGFIEVDADYETSVKGVYAIGDVVGGAMLAHKASDEGIACVEKIVNGYGHVNLDVVPAVVYIHPEVAYAGRTEEALKDAGIAFRKGVFAFRGNGRALAMDDADGFVKILANAQTDRVLGVHIIGPRAGDLLQEAVSVMEMSGSSEDMARIFHAHPSLAEAVKEAALDVDDRAIHS